MEKTIKETTRLLLNGTLTKEDADKILLDLYNVSGRSEQVCCPRCKSVNWDGSGLTLNCNDCDYQWQQTCH